jgi:hypothetical protein
MRKIEVCSFPSDSPFEPQIGRTRPHTAKRFRFAALAVHPGLAHGAAAGLSALVAVKPGRDFGQNQIYVVSENQVKTMDKPKHNIAPNVIDGRINGRFAPGYSGNPGGSPEATRRAFNKRFLLDLAEDWQQHGREVFKRVRRESPASYLKICAMLVAKEVKLVHSTSAIKELTDEELEQTIQAIRAMLAAQAENTKIIEATAEPTALPGPTEVRQLQRKRSNRLLEHVDAAIDPSDGRRSKPQ